MTHRTETPAPKPSATLTALIRAAAEFAYDVGRQIRDENGKNAQALAAVLTDDPAAETIIAVRITPTQFVTYHIVTRGKPFKVYETGVVEVEGIRH